MDYRGVDRSFIEDAALYQAGYERGLAEGRNEIRPAVFAIGAVAGFLLAVVVTVGFFWLAWR